MAQITFTRVYKVNGDLVVADNIEAAIALHKSFTASQSAYEDIVKVELIKAGENGEDDAALVATPNLDKYASNTDLTPIREKFYQILDDAANHPHGKYKEDFMESLWNRLLKVAYDTFMADAKK